MTLVQRSAKREQCPRCSGPVYADYDGDYCCMHCGEYIYLTAPRLRWEDLSPPAEPGKRKRGRPRKHPVAA